MLDSHVAEVYGVETKVLRRAVRRNRDRFPDDFMFELTREEYKILRSQFGTLRWGEHAKYLPYVFTEQGVAMRSSVLNSKRAVSVNIEIMRAFVRLREMLATHKDLARKLEGLEKKHVVSLSNHTMSGSGSCSKLFTSSWSYLRSRASKSGFGSKSEG